MIQQTLERSPSKRAQATRPVIWGLDAPQLHDAYWRGQGIQCVRRGKHDDLDRQADLYLLIESDQLVLFPMASLAERVAWRAASVSRLRIVSTNGDDYAERV